MLTNTQTIELLPKQGRALSSKAANVGYGGAWGSGKTTALCIWIAQKAEVPNNFILIGRKTYDELRDTTQKEFFDIFPDLKQFHNKNENATYLPNKTTILWRHLDEWHKLTNLNLGAFAIDQAEEIAEQCFIALQGRLRRNVEGRQAFIVFNTEGHNWIWKLFKKEKRKGYELIETTTFDNPFLPDDYFDRLKELPENVQKRYVWGSWAAFGGLVYNEFIEDKHVIEPHPLPDIIKKGFCLDHGFRNPTAVLWYYINQDGEIIIYDEHYEAEKSISHHAEQIKKRGLLSGICDPTIFNKTQSKGTYIYSLADEYRDNGITLIPAIKTKEEATINRVNEFFKQGKIKIFKSCDNTINEILTWKWKHVKPNYTNSLPEEPEDRGNHACDDIKYIVASRFSAPIEDTAPKIEKGTVAWFLEQDAINSKNWRSKYKGK